MREFVKKQSWLSQMARAKSKLSSWHKDQASTDPLVYDAMETSQKSTLGSYLATDHPRNQKLLR